MNDYSFDENDQGDLELNSWYDKLMRFITKKKRRGSIIDRGVVNSCKSSERHEIRMMKYINGAKSPVRNIFSNGLRERRRKFGNCHNPKELREKGNLVLRISKNYLLCSKVYTEALFSARGNSEETALSHANRAYVLMQLGKFQEAYDDCECCLATEGYPQSKIIKIILRQADCAIHLSDIEKINQCIEKFEEKDANDLTPAELTAILKLKKKLETLKDAVEKESPKVPKEKNQILCNLPQKGRYVVAGEPVLKNEIIMNEKAFAFVPIFYHYSTAFDIHYICQGCAETEIVPFPCNNCRNVSYCSIKCRQDHAIIHNFECKGYSKGIFPAIGVSYLALRTFLVGFPEMLQHLRKAAQSPEEIWDEIMAFSDRGHNKYCEIIRLSTNFDKMDMDDYLRYALAASLLTVYLKEYSTIFDTIKSEIKHVNYTNWEIVVSSLLFRHVTQMVSNAYSITGFTLDEGVEYFWNYGDLPKLGSLHHLENKEIFSAIYPRVSLYNHCCEPSFTNRFNKSFLTVIAEKDLQEGDEIFNCYGVNFKQKQKECRKSILKAQYRFDCDCKHCKGNDEEFKKYHTYRCTNVDCKRLFTPKPWETSFWELLDEGAPDLKCPHCKHDFYFRWLDIFTALLGNPSFNKKKSFVEAYNIYKTSHLYVEGQHDVKEKMCWQMLRDCTDLYDDITTISYLIDVANDLLLLIEEKKGIHSMEFVSASTYYLDLLATRANEPGSFKPKYDLEKIQSSFEILSDKMQQIFKNYINQYIAASCVCLMQNVTISNPTK